MILACATKEEHMGKYMEGKEFLEQTDDVKRERIVKALERLCAIVGQGVEFMSRYPDERALDGYFDALHDEIDDVTFDLGYGEYEPEQNGEGM
jgi:hypothetical protein